jgi:hypothetical protein
MRTKHLSFVVLFVVVFAAMVAVPASAGGGLDLLGGVSWPLFSQREVEVHAGLSQHLKLADSPTGLPAAVPAIEPAVVPMDRRYHLFDDLRYLRVDLMTQGVDPARVKRTDMQVWGEQQSELQLNAYTLSVDLQSLVPDEKVLTAEVTHNSSRRESEVNLILFRIKSVKHVKTTDRVVSRFLLVDVSDWIEWATPRLFGAGVSPTNLTSDQRNLLRAAVIEDQMRDSLQFVRPLPRYELQADFLARCLRGQLAPFEAPKGAPQQQGEKSPAPAEAPTSLVQLEVLRWTGCWVSALSTQTAVVAGGCYRVQFSSPPGYVSYRWGGGAGSWSQPVNVCTTTVDIPAPLCGASR